MANTTNNGSMCPEYAPEEAFSLSLRIYFVVSASFFTLVLLVCAYFWWHLQQDPFLKVRKPRLIAICWIGCFLTFVHTLLYRSSDGISIDCVTFTLLEHIALPAIGCSYVVRFLLWGNKIRFNYYVATQIAATGLENVSSNDARFRKHRIPASNSFGWYITAIFFFPYIALLLIFTLTVVCV